VVPIAIDVEEKRALFAHARTEAAWRVTPPAGAVFKTSLALAPGVWSQPGDGVVFRVFARDAGRTIDLLNRHLDPRNVAADRHWIPVDIDLSPLAGRSIELVLLTEPSPPGVEPHYGHDWGLWGEPRIVTAGMR
jgi:hypothetical protein